MMNDRQAADEVLARIARYEKKKKRTRKIVLSVTGGVCAFALLFLAAAPMLFFGGFNAAEGGAGMDDAPNEAPAGDEDADVSEGDPDMSDGSDEDSDVSEEEDSDSEDSGRKSE